MSRSDPRCSRLLHDRSDVERPFPGRTAPGEPQPAPNEADPVDEAYRRGYEDGRVAGEQAALRAMDGDLAARTAEIGRALAALEELRAHVIREAETRLLGIVVDAASRVVRVRIDGGDPVAARALQEALDAAPKTERLEARVHPDDAPAVREAMAEAVDAGVVGLVEDPSVGRGGCVVDTGVGTLDARVDTALDLVRDALDGGEETT